LLYLGARTANTSLYFIVTGVIQTAAWFWVLSQFFHSQTRTRTFFLTLLAFLYFIGLLFIAAVAYRIVT
jgi:hypothetical protein